MALIHTSAQNIDRVVSIFRACKRTNRKLIIDLYAAAILEATGNKHIPQSDWPEVALFIPYRQRIQIKDNHWFELLKRHSKNRIFPEDLKEICIRSVLLFRPLHQKDLEKAGCLNDAIYIYSQWEGYWDKDNSADTQTWLEKNNIPKISIHTSGHASVEDLQNLVAAIQPQKVVPIHTFARDRYAELYPTVEIHEDGEWWGI